MKSSLEKTMKDDQVLSRFVPKVVKNIEVLDKKLNFPCTF